jgi:hypothetical protein
MALKKKRKRKPKKKKTVHQYLVAAVRKIWYYSEVRKAVIDAAKVGPDLVKCAKCHKLIPYKMRKTHAVDHIDPVGKQPKDFSEWGPYLERMFHNPQQVLCLPCHKVKTANERKHKKTST